MNIRNIITQLKSPRLYRTHKTSAKEISKLKEQFVFQSRTLNELFTDAFEYKGKEKGIIYLKDKITGRPTPVIVKISQKPYFFNKRNMVEESVYLINPKTKTVIADKHYDLKNIDKNKKIMYQGEMHSYDDNFVGAGIRMDQIQIARALELGIEYVPRTSYPQAIIYHLKMGFLPIEDLQLLHSIKELKKCIKSTYQNFHKKLPQKYFKPLIKQNNHKFYLDKGWTITRASILKCQEILKKAQNTRIKDFDSFAIQLQLRNEELEKWKNLLKKYPILNKLNPIENKII